MNHLKTARDEMQVRGVIDVQGSAGIIYYNHNRMYEYNLNPIFLERNGCEMYKIWSKSPEFQDQGSGNEENYCGIPQKVVFVTNCVQKR